VRAHGRSEAPNPERGRAQGPRMSAHATPGHRAALPLLLAWTAVVVYASWFPLTGWRWPTTDVLLGLLRLPWPRWHDGFDTVANLLGYVPLGACLALTLARAGGDGVRTAGRAVLAAAALSYLLEVGQGLLPQRFPSLLDWLLNTAGATAGAMLGLWIERTSSWGWLRRTGEHWFAQHSRTGFALLLLWPLGLLFPTPVALGLGHVWEPMGDVVREAAGHVAAATPWLHWLDTGPVHTARLSPPAELLAVALGLLGPCLLTYTMAQPGLRRVWLALGATALAFGVTTLSTALNFGPQHALAWCTNTSLAGLMLGCLLALLVLGSGRRMAAGLGLMVITAGLAMVAQAPADPYYAQSLHDWEQGRFIRFHGLAQWIGWSWPYLAMLWLLRQIAGRD
jgi:VanZ family protein